MSQISPYARSASERNTNRKTTAIFLGVVAVVGLAAVWLFGEREPPDPPDLSDKRKTEIKSTPDVDAAVIDWSARISEIERELSNSDTPELREVRQRLQAIASLLANETLSTDSQLSVQRKLGELREQAKMLNAHSDPQKVDFEEFTDSLESTIAAITMTEQDAIQQSREQAEAAVRHKMAPALRTVRLEVRDRHDTAANLRKQIAQLQREQKMFQAKADRTEALQREMPDVESYLSPFTAPGHLQPKSDSNPWDVERTADAKPVSLARLKRLGALEQTMEGLERLYIFGGGKNAVLNNSRPLGSFPQYSAQQLSKPEVLAAVKRAQQLIRDHGQALVEEQLLSP